MTLADKVIRDSHIKGDIAVSRELYGNLTGIAGLSIEDWIVVIGRDCGRAFETGRFYYED